MTITREQIEKENREIREMVLKDTTEKWEINQADLSKIDAIPELTQEEKEQIACLDNKDSLDRIYRHPDNLIVIWFTKWGNNKITEQVANKFLLRRDELWEDLYFSSLHPLISSLWEIKRDFLKQITEVPESDSEEAFGLAPDQIFREAKELCATSLSDTAYELWESHNPIMLWAIREIASFLSTLRHKKYIGVTQDGEVSAFGERFIFGDKKLVEHLLANFDFSEENWLKEHEAKEVYAKDGKPTALGRKIECYRRFCLEHDRQRTIAEDMRISQSAVAQWVNHVEGAIAHDRGKAFENYFARVKAPLKYKQYIQKGGNSEFDGEGFLENGDIEVVSLKCFSESRNSVTMGLKDLRPEIAEVRKLRAEGKKANLRLVFHECLRNFDEERIIDPDIDQPITFVLPVKKE